MNATKIITAGSKTFIGLSVFSLGYVAFLSMVSPQSTMDLVATYLPNTDAISSIRGVYGGVGIVLAIQLVYLLIKDYRKALLFLSLFWGAYAVSRVITMMADGPLGAFGSQWLVIESVFCLLATVLFVFSRQTGKA